VVFVVSVKSVAVLKVGRDYGVALLDLKIAGLREVEGRVDKYRQVLDSIQTDVAEALPHLGGLYALDIALEDAVGRRYFARLLVSDGIVHYVVLTSPKNSLRGVLKRLMAQGWALLVLVEKKSLKTSPPSETDVQ